MAPSLAAIRRFKQSQGGAGEDRLGIARVFRDDVRASMGTGNALYLIPHLAAAIASINTATSAGEYQVRVLRIYFNGENIGVVDQPRRNRMPGGSSVRRFPRQVWCAGGEHVLVGRIESQRGDVLHLRIVRG